MLSAQYDGPRSLVGPLIDELTTRAIAQGLGPCGPVLLDFPDYVDPRSEARLSGREAIDELVLPACGGMGVEELLDDDDDNIVDDIINNL